MCVKKLRTEVSARAGSWNHTHAYDAAGNLTTLRGQSRTYDYQNQLTGGTGLGSFEYDERGNPTTFNGVSLSWDEQNNLTTVGSATSPTLTAGYSADGLRAWKDSGTSKTYFLYDGTTPILEMDDSGNALALNTLGANGLVSRWEQSKDSSTSGMTGATDATEGNLSGTAFYSFDERGNVSDVDYANSSYTDVLGTAYDAYGIGGSGLGVFAFGGQHGYYTDSETGLVLCTYRYYDPSAGRWLNRDPIGYDGGLNTYAYCVDNSIMGVDPSGLTVTVIFDRKAGTLSMIDNNDKNNKMFIKNNSGGKKSVERFAVFSGMEAYRNDPTKDNVKGTGPIPAGLYLISPIVSNGHMGKHFQLLAQSNNWKYDARSSLDKLFNVQSSSRDLFNWHAGRISEG